MILKKIKKNFMTVLRNEKFDKIINRKLISQ